MQIFGITGTIGAGKGTIVAYLKEKYGFAHYSVREYLLQEIDLRGLPRNRDTMVVVANNLRARYSSSYIIDQLYAQAKTEGKNCVIESIRTPGEVFSLQEKGNFYLVAVDADPVLRYERIFARQSETDRIDFQTFIENENREMDASDPSQQNLRACIKLAQFVLYNNGSLEMLEQQIEQMLHSIPTLSL